MKRALLVFAGVAATLVLAAGCGGDGYGGGDDDNSPGGAAGTTTGTASETETTTPASGSRELTGIVGPGFTITLTDAGGAAIETLAPGAYTIAIDDRSTIHNFHLTGPGVDEATEVPATGAVSWEVTLESGTYNYVCDPHASTMKGSFEVS